MHGNIKRIILFSLAGVLVVGLGVWWYSGFSLDFMKFFAAAPQNTTGTPCPPGTVAIGSTNSIPPHLICVTPTPTATREACPAGTVAIGSTNSIPPHLICATPSPTPTPPPASPVVDCAPDTQTVAVGTQATLHASNGNDSYTWFAPRGSPETGTGKTFSVSYANPGTKKVTVQSSRGDQSQNIDSVACTVIVQ